MLAGVVSKNPYFTTGERLAIIKRMTGSGTYPGSPGFEDVMRMSRVDRRYTEYTRIEERIRNHGGAQLL